MGKSSDPPQTPDYRGAATEQGLQNLQAARLTAMLSNPNVVTPYGSQSVNWGQTPVFDQTGYDAAMQAYNTNQTQAGNNGMDANGIPWWYSGAQPPSASGSTGGGMPTRDQFTTYQQNDQPTITQSLSPEQQALYQQQVGLSQGLFGSQNQALQNVNASMAQPFDTSQLPGMVSSVNPGNIQFGFGGDNAMQMGLDTSGVPKMPIAPGTTAYDAMLSRLQPTLDRERTALQSQLANQGLTLGGDAYSAAMRDQATRENDLYSALAAQGVGLDLQANQQGFGQALSSGQFANSAQLQAYQEAQNRAAFNNQAQAQQFGQGMSNASLANSSQAQALQEQAYLRSLPLNELNALRNGSQVQNPQFQGYQGSSVTPGNYAQAAQLAGQYAGNLYSNQVAQQNAQTQGLFGLGSAGLNAYGMYGLGGGVGAGLGAMGAGIGGVSGAAAGTVAADGLPLMMAMA